MSQSEKFISSLRSITSFVFYVGVVFSIGRFFLGGAGVGDSVKLAFACAFVYLFSEVTQSMRRRNEIDAAILQKQKDLEKQLMQANQKLGGIGMPDAPWSKPVVITFDEQGNPNMPDGMNDTLKSILGNLKFGPGGPAKTSRLEDLSLEALHLLHQKAVDEEDFERAAVIHEAITKKGGF